MKFICDNLTIQIEKIRVMQWDKKIKHLSMILVMRDGIKSYNMQE